MNLRNFEEKLFKTIMILATSVIAFIIGYILYTILRKGLPYLTWEVISTLPESGFYIGKGGGILNAIVGSIYITLGSIILGLIISLPVVLYLNVYLKAGSLFGNLIRLSSDVLLGIPSIVYGAFGFILMVSLGLKTSLLAGIITVAFLIIPILIRSMDVVMGTIPQELADAAYSLGTTRWEVSKILIRQSIPGIITAILISFGRAIGDGASVLFTAGFTDGIPTSLDQSAATLPLSIFFQLGSPIEEVQGRAYAAAVVLTGIVLVISISSKYFSKKLSKNTI
jgi:phosphate transport system permease protein